MHWWNNETCSCGGSQFVMNQTGIHPVTDGWICTEKVNDWPPWTLFSSPSSELVNSFLLSELQLCHSAGERKFFFKLEHVICTAASFVFEKFPAPRARAINLRLTTWPYRKVEWRSPSSCTRLAVKLGIMTCMGLIFGRWNKKLSTHPCIDESANRLWKSVWEANRAKV